MIFRLIQYGIGLLFTAIIAYQDRKEYKIKNRTVCIFIAVGLVFSFFSQGFCSPLQSALGIVVPLVLFPLYALKMLGAGDIKAFCALGAVFGAVEVIKIMACSMICGGVIALCFMIFRKNGVQRLKNFGKYMKTCFAMRRLLKYEGITQNDAVFRFAYGIAAGTAAYIVYSSYIQMIR